MTTLSAVQRDPWLRAYCQRLKKNGKLPKVAPSLIGGLHQAEITAAPSERLFCPQRFSGADSRGMSWACSRRSGRLRSAGTLLVCMPGQRAVMSRETPSIGRGFHGIAAFHGVEGRHGSVPAGRSAEGASRTTKPSPARRTAHPLVRRSVRTVEQQLGRCGLRTRRLRRASEAHCAFYAPSER
jgi:hypothetical protein